MKIRTAIFSVYVMASAIGYVILMGWVLQDVRPRYVEAMRRTLADTAAFLAVYAGEGVAAGGAWAERLAVLPPDSDLLRVFACDRSGRVLFDSANGRDVGQVYPWTAFTDRGVETETSAGSKVALVGDELRVAAVVRVGGEVVGTVGVGRPVASMAEGVRHARWRLAAIAFAIALAMLVAGWRIAQRLTHSIERLTAHALAVRDGRPSQPPASRATEISALTQAFEEMRLALEGKAYVERYTQTLAHEIKAPLSAIRGAAELLREDLPPVEREKFLANLCAESARIQRIVDRLLELASIEARRGRLHLVPVDLRAAAQEVATGALSTAAARKIELTVRVGEPVRVFGEKFLLTQAISNLVHNALEFTSAGGEVVLALRVEGGRVHVVVDDTGPGVPEFAMPRLFERFYSLPRPDTGRKSTGLGLSIVREIVRLHGGEVTMANRPEGGARAVIVLPAA